MSHLRRVGTVLQGQIQYRAILLVNFLAAVSKDRDLLQVPMNPEAQRYHYQFQEYQGGTNRVAHKQTHKNGTDQNIYTNTKTRAPADRELETRPGATADHTRCFFLL